MQETFTAELRERHLNIPNPNEGASVSDLLQAAYDDVVAQAASQNR